jgi:hypothetical protein
VVTDFGVAKALTASSGYGAAASGPGLTSMGVTLGTPHYMAPEQGTGDPGMDHRVDIYAFGATAYEILTGEPPFSGNSAQAILGAHIVALPRPITAIRPGMPPLLGHIVMQCLEKRPADRPQSAEEIIRGLDALATPTAGTVPLAVISGPHGTRPVETKRGSPLRRVVVPLAVAGVALAVALFAWPRGEGGSHEQAGLEPSAPAAESVPAAAPAPTPPVPPVASLDTFRPETTAPPVRRRPPAQAPKREPDAEDEALLGRMRAEAIEARSRAAAAGVAETALARGDSSLARAESLASRRRTAEAAAAFSAATTLWSDAAARPRISAPPPPAPETLQRPVPARPAPPPAPAPQPDPPEQIRGVFAEYGAAIESRSVDAIRRVYPALSPAQSREWEEFFRGVREMDVELEVTALEVSGESAAAQLAGVYVFEDPTTHRTRREHVAFQAQLRREGGRWRIASLR